MVGAGDVVLFVSQYQYSAMVLDPVIYDGSEPTTVRITKSQAKYCTFLSVAGVLKVCRLLRAIFASSPMALKRVREVLKRRIDLGWALGGEGMVAV